MTAPADEVTSSPKRNPGQGPKATPKKQKGERVKSAAGKRPVERNSGGVEICATIEPGTLVGDYRVIQKLDEGGMGTVYEGVHPVIGKRVAIKLLHPHVARQEVSVARFIQEARAVNAIGHREIVDIFGFGKFTDGRQYIVMEFLKGRHLLAFLNENGPLEPLKACPLVRRIAGALEAAHEKGVIHRDLKPENVFLLPTKARTWPPGMKLLDFGLAKLVEDKFREGPQTRMGATVGTPYYMAPEQCRGRTVDPRTDVYALGVMFYEMITGRVPFYDEQPVDVLYMHLTKEPDPPSLWADVAHPIEKLILDCMSKPPELRPSTMNAVIARIEHVERKLAEEDEGDDSSFADLLATTAQLLGAPSSEQTAKPESETLASPSHHQQVPAQAPPAPALPDSPSSRAGGPPDPLQVHVRDDQDTLMDGDDAYTEFSSEEEETESEEGVRAGAPLSEDLPGSPASDSKKAPRPLREPTEQIRVDDSKKAPTAASMTPSPSNPYLPFALGLLLGLVLGIAVGLLF